MLTIWKKLIIEAALSLLHPDLRDNPESSLPACSNHARIWLTSRQGTRARAKLTCHHRASKHSVVQIIFEEWQGSACRISISLCLPWFLGWFVRTLWWLPRHSSHTWVFHLFKLFLATANQVLYPSAVCVCVCVCVHVCMYVCIYVYMNIYILCPSRIEPIS